jgi:hypothetical protein
MWGQTPSSPRKTKDFISKKSPKIIIVFCLPWRTWRLGGKKILQLLTPNFLC